MTLNPLARNLGTQVSYKLMTIKRRPLMDFREQRKKYNPEFHNIMEELNAFPINNIEHRDNFPKIE